MTLNNLKITDKGTWAIKGDSLIREYDDNLFDINIDDSKVVVQAGKQESLDEVIKTYIEYYRETYKQEHKNNKIIVRKARLDNSRNKLELKGIFNYNDGESIEAKVYLLRKN